LISERQSQFRNRIIIIESGLLENQISQVIVRAVFYRFVGDMTKFNLEAKSQINSSNHSLKSAIRFFNRLCAKRHFIGKV
jgi:23S rRNA A1618 N6-methylase RlmF